MSNFSAEELQEAQLALVSTLHKCEKVSESEKLGKSQQTLLKRRIKALRLALTLIEEEQNKISS